MNGLTLTTWNCASHRISLLFVLLQLQLNTTLGNMVSLIENLSNISDSTDLWGTLNTVSEALGSMLRVVTRLIGDENLGNVTNSSITNDNYTPTVSKRLWRQARVARVRDESEGNSSLKGEEHFSLPHLERKLTNGRNFTFSKEDIVVIGLVASGGG